MIASTRVRKIGVATAALLVVLSAGTRGRAESPAAPAAVEPSQLRILYVGHPGSDREKDFVGFLQKYFDVVRTGNLQTFKEADTQGFDVTILDYDGDGFQAPRPMVSAGFSKPLVTVGVAGGLICDRWGLKTGYL